MLPKSGCLFILSVTLSHSDIIAECNSARHWIADSGQELAASVMGMSVTLLECFCKDYLCFW